MQRVKSSQRNMKPCVKGNGYISYIFHHFILTNIDNFCDFLFAFLHNKPLLKIGPFLKEIDPFQEGGKNSSARVAFPESESIPSKTNGST